MTVIKTDTEISKLIINTLSQSQYLEAKEAGTISDTEMYVVTDDVVKQKMVSALNLFDYKWSDHLLNSKLWIRADNFQWHSNVYFSIAYNHLVADIDGKTATTETIGETTITYYLADDGHKIVLPDQESNVTAIYEATGVAWYYILDTTNQRFKLPRTKFAFTGLRDTAGGYVEAGLPNITGLAYSNNTAGGSSYYNLYSGALGNGGTTSSVRYASPAGASEVNAALSFDASRSSSIYGNSTTVQPPATQMYLYCYIGEDAMVENAGIDIEVLDEKVDINDLVNVVATVDTYHSGSGNSWYRIDSDDWCNQGGVINVTNSSLITLPLEMRDTSYNIKLTSNGSDTLIYYTNKTTSTFTISSTNTSTYEVSWEVKGYKA